MTKKIDDLIDSMSLNKYEFKDNLIKAACFFLAEKAAENDTFWPDEVLFETIMKEDAIKIGSAYQVMRVELKIIEVTKEERKSTKTGKKIFMYKTINKALAKAFIKKYKRDAIISESHPTLPGFE